MLMMFSDQITIRAAFILSIACLQDKVILYLNVEPYDVALVSR